MNLINVENVSVKSIWMPLSPWHPYSMCQAEQSLFLLLVYLFPCLEYECFVCRALPFQNIPLNEYLGHSRISIKADSGSHKHDFIIIYLFNLLRIFSLNRILGQHRLLTYTHTHKALEKPHSDTSDRWIYRTFTHLLCVCEREREYVPRGGSQPLTAATHSRPSRIHYIIFIRSLFISQSPRTYMTKRNHPFAIILIL